MSKRIVLSVVFCISLTLLLAGGAVRGWYMGDDSFPYFNDTQSYLEAGKRITSWLSSGEPSFEVKKTYRFPFYAISSVLLHTVHNSLSMGATGVIILNSIMFSITVCLAVWFWTTVYSAWSQVWGRRGLFLGAAGGLYVMFGLPDGFLWSYAILTDTMFTFWVAVFVIAVAQAIMGGGRYLWFLALIVALTAPFVRPMGLILPPLLVFALASVWAYRKGMSAYTAVLVSVGLTSVFAFVLFPLIVLVLMNKPSLIWGSMPDYLSLYTYWIVLFFEKGVVIKTRVELRLDTPPSYLGIIEIMLHRLWYYWIPIRFGDRPYSMMHNIVNFLYIVAMLPLFFVGVVRLFRQGRDLALAALFLLMVGYVFALAHAMSLVGFDWRYQVPAMVPFWIFAGCGLYTLLGYPMRDRVPREG